MKRFLFWSASLSALFAVLPAVPAQGRTRDLQMKVGKAERDYRLHVPASYGKTKDAKVPLVLMLHGRGSSGRQASSRYYGWTAKSDKEGFIAVYPNALGRPRSWKPAWGVKTTDDTRFLAMLIEKLGKEYRIDKQRVYMTGHSSGGIMSFSFAATDSEKVTAIAPVAGTIGWDQRGRRAQIPKPKAPVPVLLIHGMADWIVPYDKERGRRAAYSMLIPAPVSARFWAVANGLDEKPVRKTSDDGNVHIDTWSGKNGAAPVVFYSIENGSHSWPGGRRRSVRATDVIWEFFKRQVGAARDGAAGGDGEKKPDKAPPKSGDRKASEKQSGDRRRRVVR